MIRILGGGVELVINGRFLSISSSLVIKNLWRGYWKRKDLVLQCEFLKGWNSNGSCGRCGSRS